jgi:hypothetical protein
MNDTNSSDSKSDSKSDSNSSGSGSNRSTVSDSSDSSDSNDSTSTNNSKSSSSISSDSDSSNIDNNISPYIHRPSARWVVRGPTVDTTLAPTHSLAVAAVTKRQGLGEFVSDPMMYGYFSDPVDEVLLLDAAYGEVGSFLLVFYVVYQSRRDCAVLV